MYLVGCVVGCSAAEARPEVDSDPALVSITFIGDEVGTGQMDK